LADPVNGVIGDAIDNVVEVSFGIEAVEFCGLCRPPNYAERFWSNQSFGHSLRPVDGTTPQLHSA
jgi:hypothetical protein